MAHSFPVIVFSSSYGTLLLGWPEYRGFGCQQAWFVAIGIEILDGVILMEKRSKYRRRKIFKKSNTIIAFRKSYDHGSCVTTTEGKKVKKDLWRFDMSWGKVTGEMDKYFC
jgi:hypothetical protein